MKAAFSAAIVLQLQPPVTTHYRGQCNAVPFCRRRKNVGLWTPLRSEDPRISSDCPDLLKTKDVHLKGRGKADVQLPLSRQTVHPGAGLDGRRGSAFF